MKQIADLTGVEFGDWTVLSRANKSAENRAMWTCRCRCGTVRAVLEKTLRSGASSGCGCTRLEKSKAASSAKNTRHGMHGTRLYKIWHSMKCRTLYPGTNSYERYGGRGICVCKEWSDSFEGFMKWAMRNGYSEDLTIDRINPNGNYCPENCRWATWSEQARNRASRLVTEV